MPSRPVPRAPEGHQTQSDGAPTPGSAQATQVSAGPTVPPGQRVVLRPHLHPTSERNQAGACLPASLPKATPGPAANLPCPDQRRSHLTGLPAETTVPTISARPPGYICPFTPVQGFMAAASPLRPESCRTGPAAFPSCPPEEEFPTPVATLVTSSLFCFCRRACHTGCRAG